MGSAELRTKRIRGDEVREAAEGEGLGHTLRKLLYAIIRAGVFTLRVMGRKGTFFDLCSKKMAVDTMSKNRFRDRKEAQGERL